jgi:predicted Zn-ribbon and HTH transcriptional regulator
MFRLDLHELLFVYAGLCLAIIFVASVLHNIRRSRGERLAHRGLVKCHLCAFEFRDSSSSELAHCPCCGAPANRDRVSRL